MTNYFEQRGGASKEAVTGNAIRLQKAKRPVSFDERALLIGGRRELLISGEIHYPRVPEGEWERILDTTKAAGVNCIATYVFWNLHEQERDCYDFSNGKKHSAVSFPLQREIFT